MDKKQAQWICAAAPVRPDERRRTSLAAVGVGLFMVSLAGCESHDGSGGVAALPSAKYEDMAPAAAPAAESMLLAAAGETRNGLRQPGGREDAASVLPRKIIYNANIRMVVESVTSVAKEITRLVKEGGGYVSETDIASYTSQYRQATWKVRIPVDRFDSFVATLLTLGEVQQNHVDTQDVSQEYYDLDARIATKQQEEKRLLKHLSDSTGKLEDILAVERELSRVRGEIEQMQGRFRFLTHQTALSTVVIVASEIRGYTPPVRPTFGAQISRTFHQSTTALMAFGKQAVLFCVALAPWLPVIVVAAFVVLALARLMHRRARASWLRNAGGAPQTEQHGA